jgi:hypothetical protein
MRIRFGNANFPGDGWRFRGFGAARATVRVGSTGTDVSDLQEMLNALGYNVPVNGHFDAIATLVAVTDFQLKNGLNPDGIVGPLTWGKLTGTGGVVGPAPRVTVGPITIEKVTPSTGVLGNVAAFFSDPLNAGVAAVLAVGIGWAIFKR